MQSWGDESKFEYRRTRREPTKSGVTGMIASALGRRRTEPIDDLASLRFGVRVDREGVNTADYDYQITRAAKRTKTGYIEVGYGEYEIEDKQTVLSYRYYLYDASFVAGLEGDEELLNSIAYAIQHPMWPLFLGRRSCPPSKPVLMRISNEPLEDALRHAELPYRESERIRYCVETAVDGDMVYAQMDMPVTFDKQRRKFAYRRVHEYYDEHRAVMQAQSEHDPMATL